MTGYILIAFLVVYLAAAFVLPSYRVWKRTGVNPVTFRGADNAHDYIGKLFKIVMAGLFASAVVFAFFPGYYRHLLPVYWLDYPALRYAGLFLLIVSLAWTVIAQFQMGNSWRIGIDEEKRTELVEIGVFGISRNPIFLGMMVTLAGFFLIIPNSFTLLFLVLGLC